MNLLNNSHDLLNIVLSFCVLWLTIFIAWFIYYLAMIMRQLFQVVKETREKVNKTVETIKIFKEKIDHSVSCLALIGEGIKKLVEIAKSRTEDWTEKKKTSMKK